MADLTGVLSRIPGLAGYLGGQQIDQQQQMGQLQQVSALQGILSQVQKRQQEEGGRAALAELGPNATSEEVMAKMRPYVSPEHMFQWTQAAELKKATADQTKQIAMQNLQQKISTEARHAFEFAQTLPLKERQTAIQEINSAASNLAKQGSLLIQAGNYQYATGGDTSPIMDIVAKLRTQGSAIGGPGASPAQPQSAPQGGVDFSFNGVRGTVPNEQAAMDLAARMGIGTGRGAPAAQGALSAPPQEAAAPVQAPAPTNNLDARDLGAMSRGPVMGSTPVTPAAPVAAAPVQAPAAPQMPAFSGSPKERAAAENKWKLAQGKGGEAGGKASEATVTAVLEGRMAPPTGFALKSPYWQDVMERVNIQNPKFEGGKFAARSSAMRTFSSGPEARNVTALNTVIGHLGTLDEAAQALHNGDIRVFNTVANRLATETGDPRIQNFDTAKQAVAEETMRVFRQVGASEIEARQWGERITSSGSPAQLRGVIGTLGKLLESRVDAIGQQYERTVNNQGNPARVDPGNRQRLDTLIRQGEPANSDLENRLKKYQ